jgi:hypothetical protein
MNVKDDETYSYEQIDRHLQESFIACVVSIIAETKFSQSKSKRCRKIN